MTGPANLDTARIAAGRIKEALERSELRRERQRRGQPAPTPIEALTAAPKETQPPRCDPTSGAAANEYDPGET